jgi:hypothetical protein
VGGGERALPARSLAARAEEYVRKSLSLDDTLAEAYNALAAVEIYYKRKLG